MLDGIQSASILYSTGAPGELNGRTPSVLPKWAMARYRFIAYGKATTPRYLVVWDLAWELIDCRSLPPASDLGAAMTAAIARLAGDGWEPEGETDYGFVFIRRGRERRLLMLTPRDPNNQTSQSFDPFRRK